MSLKLAPVALTAVGFAAALALAPMAAATESSFLEELSINGVVAPGLTPDQVIIEGYRVCSMLEFDGASVLDTMDFAEQSLGLAPGQGTLFVSAATTNICPDFAG